jgi:lipopolysaccharide export LptBFGC system permease protein LptF
MTTILPEKNKKNIKKKYLFGFLSKLLIFLSVVLFVWLILEVTVHYSAKLEKVELEKRGDGELQKEINKLVDEYKEDLSDAKKTISLFNEEKQSIIEILDFIFDVKNDKTSISSVSVEQGQEAVFVGVSGVSETRDSLSELKNSLSANTSVSELDLPVSSFTKTFDIPFSITFIYTYEKTD